MNAILGDEQIFAGNVTILMSIRRVKYYFWEI